VPGRKCEEELSRKTLIGYLHDLGVVLNFQMMTVTWHECAQPQVGHRGRISTANFYKVAHEGALSLRNWTICLIQRNSTRSTPLIIEMMESWAVFWVSWQSRTLFDPGHLQKEEPSWTGLSMTVCFPISLWNVTEQHYVPVIVRMNEFVSRRTYANWVVLKLEGNKR